MSVPGSDVQELAPGTGDEVHAVTPDLIRNVAELLDQDALDALPPLLVDLHSADLADLVDILNTEQRLSLLSVLSSETLAEVLSDVEDSVLAPLLEALSADQIGAAITHLDTDDGLRLAETLAEDRRESVLAWVPAPDRAAMRQGLAFPEDSAGRLMQRELIAVPPFWTVGQLIDFCREAEDLPDEFYEIFVVDPRHRPLGQVPLNKALRTRRPVLVRDIMDTEERAIAVDTDQEQVAFRFQQYRMASAPVVDAEGRLVGVITFDDVVDVIEEEAEEDLLRLSGLGADTDLYDSVVRTTRRRFWWLLLNLGTAIAASVVIGLFDATIEQMVALAVLMPIVASMGGNAGTQTLAVAVRALATHELTAANAMRIVLKESLVGGINGIAFAVLVGLIAWAWFGNPVLGLVIGLAMIINLLVAGFFGTVIPLTCQRFGVDPAVAAAVFLTTVTDIVGFFAFLGLAWWVLI